MKPQGIQMTWVVVHDFNQAKEFFTNTLGLTMTADSPEYNWAEFSSPQGARIGVAGQSDQCPIKAGGNAVVCITVENIEEAQKELEEKGTHIIGAIQEVPGHVKLLLIQDPSGNYYQLAQMLS